MIKPFVYAALFVGLFSLMTCQKEPISPMNTTNPDTSVSDLMYVTTEGVSGKMGLQTPCEDTLRPIVMLHGYLASGDTYANHLMRFTSNGYCADRLFVFNWNSLDFGANPIAELDAFIDNVRIQTASIQVDLMGHSAGGGLCYNYLSNSLQAAKVKHYVHIASNPESQPAGVNGQVRTLNLWSDADETVAGADIPGARNIMLTGADHYEVATNENSFREIFFFLNNCRLPETTEIVPEEPVFISGKVLTLGENAPMQWASIEIYATNPTTGFRLNSTPDGIFTANVDGEWGPFGVVPGSTYEFRVQTDNSADRIVHYYREPFIRSNPLVYLRTLPPPTSTAGFLLADLPEDDALAVLAVFSASRAVIAGRDNLAVDGLTLSTPQYASADQTLIAMFLYDDGDGQTSGNPVGLFGLTPFLNGADLFFQAALPTPINIQYNGRELNVPNWKSDSEGIIVAVFD